jgi:hypothetical protein
VPLSSSSSFSRPQFQKPAPGINGPCLGHPPRSAHPVAAESPRAPESPSPSNKRMLGCRLLSLSLFKSELTT